VTWRISFVKLHRTQRRKTRERGELENESCGQQNMGFQPVDVEITWVASKKKKNRPKSSKI
jgi:hypothetical protein